jgi:hypothetical protein
MISGMYARVCGFLYGAIRLHNTTELNIHVTPTTTTVKHFLQTDTFSRQNPSNGPTTVQGVYQFSIYVY